MVLVFRQSFENGSNLIMLEYLTTFSDTKRLTHSCCLAKGGGLLIAEMLLDDDKAGPVGAILRSLYMRTIGNGKLRSGKEFEELLEKHGFDHIEIKRLDPGAGTDVILCRKGWKEKSFN